MQYPSPPRKPPDGAPVGWFTFLGYNGAMLAIIDKGFWPAPSSEIAWLVAAVEPGEQPVVTPPDYLSAAEAESWKALRTDKRRADWLIGRRTAKTLLQSTLLEQTGHTLSLDSIQILSHRDGWPQVRFLSAKDAWPALTLSISHSRDRAFCAVTNGTDRLLGADIEYIETRSDAFVSDYFTVTEQRLLDVMAPEQRTRLTNAVWSGKEAALKAIRRGLTEDTRCVTCLPHPAMRSSVPWQPMRIVWECQQNRSQLQGWWRDTDGFVLTLAIGS